jgi:hypothetical protein
MQVSAGILLVSAVVAAAEARADCLDLKVDCGANANSKDDDSPAFELCQQKLTELGGGCVEIPPGDYVVR